MTAKDARDEGLDVPEDVPDCSTLKIDCNGAVSVKTRSKGVERDFDVDIRIPLYWSWITIKGTVDISEKGEVK
jgi:hypothetical protein